jgi:hypothetical protein
MSAAMLAIAIGTEARAALAANPPDEDITDAEYEETMRGSATRR